MKKEITDKKDAFKYFIFSNLNKLILQSHFSEIVIIGRENLPRSGPFILVSNHTSRYDGLIIYNLIDRPSNFMVSLNELNGSPLKNLQGKILKSMGAFPASSRYKLSAYVKEQLNKGEGIVIFPEGNIFRTGTIQSFKKGAARLALNCTAEGIKVPIIACAIQYNDQGRRAFVNISQPIAPEDYAPEGYAGSYLNSPGTAISDLTERLYREVCYLKGDLGNNLFCEDHFQGRRSAFVKAQY